MSKAYTEDSGMNPYTRTVALCAAVSLSMLNSCRAASTIQAMRIVVPPEIDGRLVDGCWQDAKPVTGFRQYNSQAPARFQSTGYVLYDDTRLYIGVRCDEPDTSHLRTQVRPHDSNVFADDIVEIMLDPGATRHDYFQFAINASGSTFDCSRTDGGASEDDEWNSDMTAGAHIGERYWSVELAIPYYSLGITSETELTWGINLCREKPNPPELSTIAQDGVFNNARTFSKFKVRGVDFRDYSVQVGATRAVVTYRDGDMTTNVDVPIRNNTGKARDFRITRQDADAHSKVSMNVETLSLKRGEQASVPLYSLALKPWVSGRTDICAVLPLPCSKRIVISDGSTGKTLRTCNLQYPKRLRVLGIKVVRPGDEGKLAQSVKGGSIGIELVSELSRDSIDSGSLALSVLDENGNDILKSQPIPPLGSHTFVLLSADKLPTGNLTAHLTYSDSGDQVVAETRRDFVNIPDGRVLPLNNLVSELLNQKNLTVPVSLDFINPRDGWVFFSRTPGINLTEQTPVELTLKHGDSAEFLLMHKADGTRVSEAMRWLRAGTHTLRVMGAEGARVKQLIVRSIPELVYCKFPSNPQVTGHGRFDWEFLQEHLLSSVNCIVGTGRAEDRLCVERWKKEGKKWIVECPLPGLTKDSVTADEAYKAWATNPGYADPSLDGVIVDEFTGGDIHKYTAWTEALRRLITSDKFSGKSFYPYCGNLYGAEAGRDFVETVMEAGGRFVWEQYLTEQPTEQAAKASLETGIKQGMLGWRGAIPDAPGHAIVCFGYFCAPPESVNTHADVDYKVWMDMQYNLLANDPAFKGLYGVMEYTSSYADEEAVRWQGRLYRHYCIEGEKTMLSEELGFRYELRHIQNPDFDNGTTEWTLTPAQEGGLRVDHMDGVGWLEGRYPRTSEGDNFLVMKRSLIHPNVISQEVSNLQPGKSYSVKMFTADYRDLLDGKSIRQQHAVNVVIENAETIPDNSFQEVILSCYAHSLGTFNAQHRAWLNYHWLVFRAKGDWAKLVISDWAAADDPRGPIGQELLLNFVEIQPYLEWEGMNMSASQPVYQWTSVTHQAEFAPRDGAGALVFQDRLWFLGGWNPGDKAHFPKICNSEVWSSPDGKTWKLANLQAPWEGRHTAGYLVHDGKMWIVGGDGNQGHYQNDVWSSSDGVTWECVNGNVPWGPRLLHHTVAFKGKIWVMGGQTLPQFAPAEERFYSDVWNSSDGVSWRKVADNVPWGPRGIIGGTAIFQDRIWVLGGGIYDTPQRGRSYYNDVWSSADGVNWKRHTEAAPWKPRQYHDVAVFDDKLWVMEGYHQDGGNKKDVWYSPDGMNWTEVPNTPWAPRHAASVFVYDNALWMAAGNNMTSDVWKLTRVK